jgi:hypothetical protein
VRESKLDVPATPHQSTVIDAPMNDNADTDTCHTLSIHSESLQ